MSTGPNSAFTNATPEVPRVDMAALTNHVVATLAASGLAAIDAELVAESLVDAQARGIGSHGVSRTRIYAERTQAGLINAKAMPRVVSDLAAGCLVDADNAVGHVGARAGIDRAIDMCSRSAIAMAGVRNSNHCGTLAFFARRATSAGLAVIAMSTAPVTMAYFGGRTRAVGTNPLCIAVPRTGGLPLMVDMATSATARGKIILAEKIGQPIPSGWAIDPEGVPTTDPQAALAGSVLPFGGPKGSGLAMMIDLLAGAMVSGLTGPAIGDMYEDWTRPQQVSHLFVVMNPDVWSGGPTFAEKVDAFAQYVHGLPPADGVPGVLLPGDLEQATFEAARVQGVPVPPAVLDDLDSLAAEFGVATRLAAGTHGSGGIRQEGRR